MYADIYVTTLISRKRYRGRGFSAIENGEACAPPFQIRLLFLCPFLAPFDAIPLAFGCGVESEFVQLFAGKSVALAAMRLAFSLAAILDGALRAPKRFLDGKASFAFHNFAPFAFAAKQSAS
jgi:hypothetical protein